MKTLVTIVLTFVVIAVLVVAVMGAERSGMYFKGARKAVQNSAVDGVPMGVAGPARRAHLAQFERDMIALEVEAAKSKAEAENLAKEHGELKEFVGRLEREVKNGTDLLREKSEQYRINGVNYTVEEFHDLVETKAKRLQSARQELQTKAVTLKEWQRGANILHKRAKDFANAVDEEKIDALEDEKMYELEKRTAGVAQLIASVQSKHGSLLDDNPYREVRDRFKHGLAILRANNHHALLGSDINGDEVDLTTITPEEDWDREVDRLMQVGGIAQDSPSTAN